MKFKDIAADVKQSLILCVWFTVLMLPLVVMKVNVSSGVADISYRWHLLPLVAISSFVLSFIWRRMLVWRDTRGNEKKESPLSSWYTAVLAPIVARPAVRWGLLALVIGAAVAYPFVGGMYHTNIMITALVYVMLALGLNIVVGLGGLLNLGYAAFFAVGAYTYGFLWKYLGPHFVEASIHTGWLFWIALPLSGGIAVLFGVLLSLPVLRLKGDYLAIITLGFGEIIRMVLQNWGRVTGGATGINLIPRPWLFNMKLRPPEAITYIYFIALVLVILTVFVVRRLEDSRVGRALEAMREDEIACQSVGIDLVRNKLSTFALGAFWAGLAGVVLASQTTYINPDSFTIWESIMILMAVVIGGQGSVPGVIVGALLLKLLPEYFRPLAQYRMLIYGVAMIVVIIFKPDGLIPRNRKRIAIKEEAAKEFV